jgi:K+/H+ antiporter YhaU regulatory subunit KhtT
LKELDLRTRAVQVLGIERDGTFLPVPGGEDKLQVGDVIIVYGKESAMMRVFHPDSTSPLKLPAA